MFLILPLSSFLTSTRNIEVLPIFTTCSTKNIENINLESKSMVKLQQIKWNEIIGI